MGSSVVLTVLFSLLAYSRALQCGNNTAICNETMLELKSLCDRTDTLGQLCWQTNCNQNASCNMQCTDSSATNSMVIKRCYQLCNEGRCPLKMTCHVANECIQDCNGFCNQTMMQCNESESCTQLCNKDCNKMICRSPNCTQECDNGGCLMECTKEVKKCIQKCKHGACKMVCDADTCKQDCSQGATCEVIKKGQLMEEPTEQEPTGTEQEPTLTTATSVAVTFHVGEKDKTPYNLSPRVSASYIFICSFLLLKLVF